MNSKNSVLESTLQTLPYVEQIARQWNPAIADGFRRLSASNLKLVDQANRKERPTLAYYFITQQLIIDSVANCMSDGPIKSDPFTESFFLNGSLREPGMAGLVNAKQNIINMISVKIGDYQAKAETEEALRDYHIQDNRVISAALADRHQLTSDIINKAGLGPLGDVVRALLRDSAKANTEHLRLPPQAPIEKKGLGKRIELNNQHQHAPMEMGFDHQNSNDNEAPINAAY